MLIQPAYISYLRRNKFQPYFKLKKKHVDEPTFENSISSVEEKVTIPPENDETDSETDHDGDISNVVNQAVDVIKYPATKLPNQVEHVIKQPADDRAYIVDTLRRVVPIEGAGFTNDKGQMVDANSNDIEVDDNGMENTELENGEIENEWMEPDAKVRKLDDSDCFDGFQRADKHTPSRIPPTEKRKHAQRACVGCRRNGIRRDTCHYCKDCMNSPALCKDCFDNYHM